MEKYRPSSGTEGEAFIRYWCGNCARDKAMREGCYIDECDDDELCHIIATTFRLSVDDYQYPKEWTHDKDGYPCCTAYVNAGDQIPPPRDELTIDMFGEV